mmetsp:Transcript_1514/g.2309  ORF Transcript_1514/g.2309 Transcript_1514/m.2309 type:complete len:492 (+) Transcript_1514:24-1499(+)|eukprot:CAMPEP_0184671734 /NCGR_PEP_ID=MMETSP0308-20130426/85677_1 /TAXON_ID=38269 /ORGANISM="Gloeochaete witrockiana, Strain SAG 46.84" /LENGTH=491 /DNA_ID=CAMNT_0027118919 /DNA_START=18 /DNA_END=1493 /DNA_ORIENTATION=+
MEEARRRSAAAFGIALPNTQDVSFSRAVSSEPATCDRVASHRMLRRVRTAYMGLRIARTRRFESSVSWQSARSTRIVSHAEPTVVDNVPIEHQNVPEGHRSLHNYLYDSEDVHIEPNSLEAIPGNPSTFDDGLQIVSVQEWLDAHVISKVVGVFAVYSADDGLQHVGVSRDIALVLRKFATELPTLCHSVRVKTFKSPRREALEEEVANWIVANGRVPAGNAEQSSLWDTSVATAKKVMSEAEMAEYEDTKLKLRKAMGERLYEDQVVTEDDELRREKLMAAVQNDDWSAVIQDQTKRTIDVPEEQQPQSIISPFQVNPSAGSSNGNGFKAEAGSLEMTEANVDKVLDSVRPYLIADGGNVSVRSVLDDIVYLRLEGACGSCPSSTATMKMGIEKTLREKFPQLKGIVQIQPLDPDHDVHTMKPLLSVEDCEKALEPFVPVVQHIGGSVKVSAVSGLDVTVQYSGPADFRAPLVEVLKEKLPQISTVHLVD